MINNPLAGIGSSLSSIVALIMQFDLIAQKLFGITAFLASDILASGVLMVLLGLTRSRKVQFSLRDGPIQTALQISAPGLFRFGPVF
ncbi:hypothetical protein RA27_15330 [Ruegeria sp. ANG-R]|uniref:hypothetical protein n=1 Tax=Ruegeria sp. ANG-R TaxID=1577903 RepID=UPI00057F1F51|nr:hypothetical protein [Ruegeria sp. ANG-R]KIC40195.1 hypothetical protein RA27_15330 [Ruegeria sp. ANG-R]